ncbi:MAG: MDR family oxidoreductase [Pseudomonadota bacterium]|nr:MDR family oxidoreductase [Pseudomonadota bacterium]
MADKFKALMITNEKGNYKSNFELVSLKDLPDYPVLIDVAYSTVNYKDGLAITGKGGKVVRNFPMIGGVDLSGTVVESNSDKFSQGDRVLVNGWGLSETHWGGFSQKQRINPDYLTKVPESFSLQEVMAIGTAGYTAMLCILALEDMNITPEKGKIIVTGASGGVGSISIAVLAKLGYDVVACTGRLEEEDYLRSLGAKEVIDRNNLNREAKPLERSRWAGAVDSVGSKILSTILSETMEGGVVTACGNAAGIDLPTNVLPFILRGVSLLGINSNTCPSERRNQAWKRLEVDLNRKTLLDMTSVETFDRLPAIANDIVNGKIRGRVVIDVNS